MHRMFELASALATICLIGVSLPAQAQAQSDRASTEATATDGSVSASNSPSDDPDTLLEQGEFELGADLALLWSVDSSKPEGGDTVTFNSYYGDLGGHFGYMVQDLLEARVHVGWLRIVVSNQDETPQRTNALVLTPQMLLHAPVSDGLALYSGIGVGGYIGQTKRDIQIQGKSLDAENSTNGLMGQILAGVLIETGPSFALRTGLRLDGLVGRENPSEGTDLPQRNTQNVKLLGVIEGSGTF